MEGKKGNLGLHVTPLPSVEQNLAPPTRVAAAGLLAVSAGGAWDLRVFVVVKLAS
ncbi:uncharacterized protein DS421_2g45190 [Arachis hypogaea]|nr:uncharacterized protein DS421_2g45190 [Arachis hypogaea]